jgi:hypothetical protein
MEIIKEGAMSGMDKEGDDLHQAMCCIVKADEIRADKELMKKLEPYMAEHAEKVKKSASLKDLWAKGKAEASAREEDENASKVGDKEETDEKDAEEDSKESEARMKASPKISSKA